MESFDFERIDFQRRTMMVKDNNVFAGFNIDITVEDDIYYKNLEKSDILDTGLLGKYGGTPIICVPELNDINAVIVPDWGNFWNNYLKENKGE